MIIYYCLTAWSSPQHALEGSGDGIDSDDEDLPPSKEGSGFNCGEKSGDDLCDVRVTCFVCLF